MPRSYLHLFDPHPPPILPFLGGGDGDPSLNSVQVTGGTHPSNSSTASSVVIVIIVIASAVILSASLYLILRCLTRRCNRSVRTFSAADDVVLPSLRNRNDFLCQERSMADDLISSLPLFTYGSLTGDIAGGDCAVCLSKFEIKDQLRLLPLCCHAFHAQCIDAWLSSNQTCPLCRSTIHPTEEDVMNKILSSTTTTLENRERGSFRVEIGNVSRRGTTTSDSADVTRRSYSIGSFDYIVDEGFEVPVASTHSRGISDTDKESYGIPANLTPSAPPEPPGDSVAMNVAERSWLRDYIDRLASISSRTLSFRSSGRILTGSSRRSEAAVVAAEDLEASRLGEEIGELFRWLSGV